MKVSILGATGETGSSILDALVESTDPIFQVTALLRPSAIGGKEATALEKRGVKVVSTDLEGSKSDLVAAIQGQDVVISAIRAFDLAKQIPLIDAAKDAGVKRFVPCDFGSVVPPQGVLDMRERKEEIHNHIKKLYLPYTFIDVGWWYQLSFPPLPSGRVDYAQIYPNATIPGDGTTKSGLTDKRDVGQWVKRIIADERTLNKSVFAYNELWSKHEIFDLMEKLSGEKIERSYMTEEEIKKGITAALASNDQEAQWAATPLQYFLSWGVRGDNTPEYASYLGYLNAQELYPDFKPISFEVFVKELLDGQAETIYTKRGNMGPILEKASKAVASLSSRVA